MHRRSASGPEARAPSRTTTHPGSPHASSAPSSASSDFPLRIPFFVFDAGALDLGTEMAVHCAGPASHLMPRMVAQRAERLFVEREIARDRSYPRAPLLGRHRAASSALRAVERAGQEGAHPRPKANRRARRGQPSEPRSGRGRWLQAGSAPSTTWRQPGDGSPMRRSGRRRETRPERRRWTGQRHEGLPGCASLGPRCPFERRDGNRAWCSAPWLRAPSAPFP